MTNEIERFEKLQRELGTAPASLIRMLRRVESYFPSLRESAEEERRKEQDSCGGSQNSLSGGVESRHQQTGNIVELDGVPDPRLSAAYSSGSSDPPAQNSLDDVERNHAVEEYCDWMREVAARANEQAAIDDWQGGGKEELKRTEAECN